MGLNAMELFPTAVRGTCYGIAAAIGKVGATVGTLAFVPMENAMGGYRGPFLVGSGIAIFASIIAWFFVPEIGPEGLIEEDAAFRQYLIQHGYDIRNLGLTPIEDEVEVVNETGKAGSISSADKV